MSLGLYLHIPYCFSKCRYCDFYSHPGERGVPEAYVDALLRELSRFAPEAPLQPDTLYFGGGTPSLLRPEQAKQLIDAARPMPGAEITLEANPETVTEESLAGFREAGVNRISFGVQSARDTQLRTLGRPHTAKQARAAFAAARRAGFANISGDIMLALPHYTEAEFDETLELIEGGGATHISAYLLKIEPDSAFGKHPPEGLPTGDEAADFYLYAVEQLEHHGYKQYEISNFSIPGYESRHNLKYWQLDDYMGFGPGAHSCIGRTRYSYVRDLDRYLAGVLHGEDMIDEYETIGDFERAAEYLMLGMRTVHGVSRAEYERLYRSDFSGIAQQLEEFVRRGWAVADGERWHFTPSGFLLSNVLIGKLLEAQTDRKAEHNPWMKPQIEKQPRTKLPPGEAEAFRDTYLNNPILTRTDRSQNHET